MIGYEKQSIQFFFFLSRVKNLKNQFYGEVSEFTAVLKGAKPLNFGFHFFIFNLFSKNIF